MNHSVTDQLTRLEREQKRIATRIPKYEAKRIAGASITVEEATRLKAIQEEERAGQEELDRLLSQVEAMQAHLHKLHQEKETLFEKSDGLTVHEKVNYHQNIEMYHSNRMKITSLQKELLIAN